MGLRTHSMIRWVVYSLCSAGCFAAINPNDALSGWPEVHPPLNFKPKLPLPRGGLPPFHAPALQSPIDIRFSSAAKVILPPLEFEDLLNDGVRIIMRNTGTTVQFDVADNSVVRPTLMGGPLARHGVFQFSNLHVHWGTQDVLGGEHKVNSRRFAVEGHCVHFNTKYKTLEEAEKHEDGLSVVTFFAKAGNVDNPKLERLISLLPSIRYPNTSVSLTARDSLDWFADIGEPTNYFTYPGSLTTAPFTENVFWIIYPRPMFVSSRQVEAFRNLLSNELVENRVNARTVQPFNDRPLIYSV
ncbi:carbonic anhydrase 2-like isoform X1 [Homalodisca vitripennis]|uniref:carbonic anhydrase 2-like isoform X1 n=2 Tax=Homalodisca vitripennis TaxID=197043 RepID=UPI001EEBB6DF|nr:carbonic anhydrase 2-like isoform X1 [Homalodisca vitripennis]